MILGNSNFPGQEWKLEAERQSGKLNLKMGTQSSWAERPEAGASQWVILEEELSLNGIPERWGGKQ